MMILPHHLNTDILIIIARGTDGTVFTCVLKLFILASNKTRV